MAMTPSKASFLFINFMFVQSKAIHGILTGMTCACCSRGCGSFPCSLHSRSSCRTMISLTPRHYMSFEGCVEYGHFVPVVVTHVFLIAFYCHLLGISAWRPLPTLWWRHCLLLAPVMDAESSSGTAKAARRGVFILLVSFSNDPPLLT